MIALRNFLIFILSVPGICQANPQPATSAPPQQSAPWKLPEGVADADGKIQATVHTLFELGMADPRGCSYRHVTLRQDGLTREGRGWVLPGPNKVIGWNGLVYTAEEVGGAADLADDVEILKRSGELAAAPFSNFQEESLDELLSKFATTPRMMRSWAAPYLLLRLGIPLRFAAANPDPFAESPFDFGKGGKLTFPKDEYFDADDHWLVQFGRLVRGDGVAAFVGKDDTLAAERLLLFDRVWAEVEKRRPAVEGEQEEHPFQEAETRPSRPRLNPCWRSVLADSQRRLAPARESARSEIERNIAAWDQFETWDEENTPELFDKVVAAGPAAIAPLLDCLEQDTRWTRIRRQAGDEPPGELLRVRDFAIVALERILRFPVLEVPVNGQPVEDVWYAEAAATMRAFCEKYDHACGGELWFRVLKDEKADLDLHWIAAKRMVRPDGVEDMDPEGFSPSAARDRFDNPQASSEGKLLRGRHDPTVLDLLNRAYFRARAEVDEQLAKGTPEITQSTFPHGMDAVPRRTANQFLRLVEEWNPGNVDLLKSHYQWLEAGLRKVRKADGRGGFWISRLCEEILMRRFWAKDGSAMRDYESLFRTSFPFDDIPMAVMNELADEPGMDALAREAFLGDEAPLRLTQPWSRSDFPRKNLIEIYGERSPLLVLPAFRQALIEALRTTTKQGTLTLTDDGGMLRYDADKPTETDSVGVDAALGHTAAVGTTIDVRLCDLIAYFLTPKRWQEVWVSPAFHLDGSLAERDRAIADWLLILDR
ncbi:MAG: hypothetical protein V4640_01060 [Verrucomicrobiota bacterium]